MIKMSEYTPATADLMADVIARYFDPTEVTVVTGGPEVGADFSKLDFGPTCCSRARPRSASTSCTPPPTR